MVDNDVVPTVLTIASDDVSAEIDARNGGRLAQVVIDGTPLLVGWSDDVAPTGWGSYPMVPWAGRIRHGRFTFDGVEYQLPINFEDHAIHGVGFTSAWTVDDHDETSVSLSLMLPTDERWPFGGVVRQRIGAHDGGITTSMTVSPLDHPFPVSMGWHPWFRKPSSVEFHPTAMYQRDDDWVAVDELVPVPEAPWDDCFVNTEPVVAEIDGVRIRITSDCDHWVVFDMRTHATCIEPQTGPPDAFNIAVHRLDPGESLSAWYRIARA